MHDALLHFEIHLNVKSSETVLIYIILSTSQASHSAGLRQANPSIILGYTNPTPLFPLVEKEIPTLLRLEMEGDGGSYS